MVAAGTFESAKLLMRSTSTFWPKGAGNDACLVGHYIITHPYFIYTGARAKNPLRLQPEMDFPTLVLRHFDTPKEQPDGKFILVNPPDTVLVQLAAKMQAGFTRSELDAYPIANSQSSSMEWWKSSAITRIPLQTYRGGITLVCVRRASTTLRMSVQESNGSDQVSGSKGLCRYGMYAYGRCECVMASRSRCSTCRMSLDPSHGVVDKYLCVHGTDNLFVCSNAVFPSIGAINPTLTLTALALRLGDHLNGVQL